MHNDKLQTKIENFIDKTVLPAFLKIGEDLYPDGVKIKLTSKPWRKNIGKNPSFPLLEMDLSQNETRFCKISSYLSISESSQIQFSSSIEKSYGTHTLSKLSPENIDKIDKQKLIEELLKKV